MNKFVLSTFCIVLCSSALAMELQKESKKEESDTLPENYWLLHKLTEQYNPFEKDRYGLTKSKVIDPNQLNQFVKKIKENPLQQNDTFKKIIAYDDIAKKYDVIAAFRNRAEEVLKHIVWNESWERKYGEEYGSIAALTARHIKDGCFVVAGIGSLIASGGFAAGAILFLVPGITNGKMSYRQQLACSGTLTSAAIGAFKAVEVIDSQLQPDTTAQDTYKENVMLPLEAAYNNALEQLYTELKKKRDLYNINEATVKKSETEIAHLKKQIKDISEELGILEAKKSFKQALVLK